MEEVKHAAPDLSEKHQDEKSDEQCNASHDIAASTHLADTSCVEAGVQDVSEDFIPPAPPEMGARC